MTTFPRTPKALSFLVAFALVVVTGSAMAETKSADLVEEPSHEMPMIPFTVEGVALDETPAPAPAPTPAPAPLPAPAPAPERDRAYPGCRDCL